MGFKSTVTHISMLGDKAVNWLSPIQRCRMVGEYSIPFQERALNILIVNRSILLYSNWTWMNGSQHLFVNNLLYSVKFWRSINHSLPSFFCTSVGNFILVIVHFGQACISKWKWSWIMVDFKYLFLSLCYNFTIAHQYFRDDLQRLQERPCRTYCSLP